MVTIKPIPLASVRQQAYDLKVFNHHIYEYKKGVRSLILTTEKSVYRKPIENRLTREKISYAIQDVDKDKINVFFGAKKCIEVIKTYLWAQDIEFVISNEAPKDVEFAGKIYAYPEYNGELKKLPELLLFDLVY